VSASQSSGSSAEFLSASQKRIVDDNPARLLRLDVR